MAEQHKQTKKKPTLVDPDFTGLWDSVVIGKENDLFHKSWGLFCQLLFIGIWMFGCTFPLWILLLVYLKWNITVCILICIMSYSYLFEVKGWPWAVKNLILAGSYWYDGGCSMCAEMPPEGYEKNHSNDPNQQQPAMGGMHPHGMFTQGFLFNAGLREYVSRREKDLKIAKYYSGRKCDDKTYAFGPPNFHVGMVAESICKMPIFRHLLVKWTESVAPASKENVLDCMSKGMSFGLLPGGFYEASFMIRNKEQIYIKNVKGFIKYCLRFGYRIIPGYTFGESHTFDNMMLINGSVKKWLNKHKIPAAFPFGQWYFPLLPRNHNIGIHTIYSYGRVLPQIDHPTQQDIDYWHDWYISEIKGVFDRNKWRFGMDDEELHIW